MRKYLLGLFAIVMAVSLSAFTSAKETGKSAELYWFLYDATSGGTGAYLDFGEKDEFKVLGCNQEILTDCRRGYSIADLQDPSDPEQGVINDNAHDAQIRKQ